MCFPKVPKTTDCKKVYAELYINISMTVKKMYDIKKTLAAFKGGQGERSEDL